MRLIMVVILLLLFAGSVLAAEDPRINYRDVVKTEDGSYVLAGTIETPVGKQADWPRYRGDINLEKRGNNDILIWNQTFGGEKNDEARRIIRVSDGGFLVIGQTESFGNGAWVIRTDSDGRERWNRTFGKRGTDSFNAVIEMRGGGFALAGTSDAFSNKGQGAWLVRIDAQGTELWNRTYGGDVLDYAQSVAENPRGGLVIAGVTNSESGQLADALLIKTDSAGNLIWKKTFGGSGADEARSVVVTRQEEIIFTGSSFSPGLTIDDFWVVRIDAEGNERWNRKVAGKGLERGMAIAFSPENGFLVGEAVAADTWEIHLVNLDSDGTVLWDKTFTGIDPDILSGSWSLSQLTDKSLVLSGAGEGLGTWALEMRADGTETGRHLFGMKTKEISPTPQTTWRQPYAPGGWLVKTDAQGAELWNTTFGDNRIQDPFAVRQISDGGYVIAGSAVNDGIHSDAWLTFFNDKGEKTRRVILGTDGLAEIRSLQQLPDGGFILTGKHDYSGWESTKMWLIRTDSTGSKQWEKDIPDLPMGNGAYVSRSSDGGYIVSGSFQSKEHRSPDAVIVKTGADGTVIWNQTFGGSGQDSIPCISRALNGGYIAVLAITEGYMVDSYSSSATLIRLDSQGTVIWSRPLEERTHVQPSGVLSTSDGGFLVTGYAINADSLVGPWIMKTDGSGTVLWHHVFDFGSLAQKGSELAVEVPDGGYAMIGDKGGDIWLVRFDRSGTELWNRTYGGWSGESARSLQVTRDGGFVIAGTTTSYPVTNASPAGRIIPLFILFTVILAGSAIILFRNELKRRCG
jgi:regulation of enolase protein 1 (concanavalin A-like superfamily)